MQPQHAYNPKHTISTVGALQPVSLFKMEQPTGFFTDPQTIATCHFPQVVRVHEIRRIRDNIADGELVRNHRNMVIGHTLRNPDSTGTSIIAQNMEHPCFLGINDCQRLTTLSSAAIATISPVSTVKTKFNGKFTHEFDRITGVCGALQSQARHLICFNTSLTVKSRGISWNPVESCSTSGFTNCNLYQEKYHLVNIWIILTNFYCHLYKEN